ncbi:ATP-dependent nuclease [Dendrosporobacter sp. 1207_IL3150]|uniref:ATP-dependent nuclease n=1 Tax=Dendrosporobacter sp. 1207_IL3150 TaxID=3084054 RepID=UPI002FDA9A7A
MAAKKKDITCNQTIILESIAMPRPRLSKLVIKNFRCIGSTPVEIELDDIVVLVGPNNCGKSSILRAYEVVMSEGSSEGALTIQDFPNGKIDENCLPEIELHTVVYDNSPGDEWILTMDNGEKLVKEKWTWTQVGKPERRGFSKELNDWHPEKRPWGAAAVSNARRPQPHKVDAFDTPENQTKEIINLLESVIKERVESFKTLSSGENEDETEYSKLLSSIKAIQKKIVAESQAEIDKVQTELTEYIDKVFPGYEIKYDARPEDDLEKSIHLFKANSQLLMGPKEGYMSTVDRQGSGARRTLLWTALRILCENKRKNGKDANRPHVLLLDEPEICLHPSAVREACDLLYSLPKCGNWQVMVTTHSPQFIDISRDNTTIVRVARETDTEIRGTTIFRPDKAKLEENDKDQLKLLNIFDPYVAEFFFGGSIIIVEGDTEYTAFKHVMVEKPDKFKNVHVIRARGKATIVSLIKILNHFGTSYSVLHDSDKPKVMRKEKEIVNPAWSKNIDILSQASLNSCKVRVVASVPNFEEAYFDEEMKAEKPYNALVKLKNKPDNFSIIEMLLEALIDHSKQLPKNAIEWMDIEQLEMLVRQKTI